MLTFSLDEYGDFEGIKNGNEPIYIAGLIYDDADDDRDTGIERNRIKAYYQAVIAEAAIGAVNASEFTYPEALHSNGNRVRDYQVVRPVKELVRITLREFIRHGTYRGNKLTWVNRQGITRDFVDRKGQYHIFVILKSDKGMTRLLGANAGILAKDDFASNLYFHMADEMIARLIFYNPVIREVKDVWLDIATRTSANMEPSDPMVSEYKRQGYRANKCDENDPNSKVYFSLTNPDVYRSVIAEEIIDADRPDLVISSFHVTSIMYRSGIKGMEFLYMADSICSVLGFDIDGTTADEWLNCIMSRTSAITGRTDNLIFGYDEIDAVYAKAWAKYKDGDYYKALSIAFDACKYEGAFAELYKQIWFKKLEERILEQPEITAFNMAVRKLYETLNNNTLDQDKCFYILNVLERMVPKLEGRFRSPEAKRILYTLYDTGVTACCHIGDSKKAEAYFEKCTESSSLVSLEDYLNTRNKMVVYCCDYFELERAEELSDENLIYQDLLSDLKKDIRLPGVREDGYLSMGKALSQRAQVYAFQRDERAEEAFRKALEHFEKGSANYKISQSYLMHYYLDTAQEEAYCAEAEIYFDGRNHLTEQLKYILEEGSRHDPLINMKYALYVWIRGLYLFRMKEVSDRLWMDLQKIEKRFGKKIGNKDWKLTGHPAELIFKYMKLIAMVRQEPELEQMYAERMANCLIYYGPTEDAIRRFGEIEILHTKGDFMQRDEWSEELCCFLRDRFSIFKDMEIPEDGEVRYQWLQDQMTFMYR